jgi:tripartite-type tricarboxylate transporter receptor subunit TctC
MPIEVTSLRTLIAVGLGSFALWAGPASEVRAQAYPAKPIRMVVPYPAGGNADITTRLVARRMSESMNTPIVIENRGGANGGIGTEVVAKAAPDGYTLLAAASGPIVINPVLLKKVPYDPQKDLAPISQILTFQYVLVTPASSAIKSLEDLIAQARSKPGTLSYGSTGIGGGGHLAGELLALMSNTRLNHVPYKGSAPALADLLGGHLAFTYDTVITSTPLIESGQLRAFAVSGPKRAGSLPRIPTMQELGYKGFEVTQFVGLFAPGGTDPAIITRLHQEVVKAIRSDELVQKIEVQGGNELVGSSPAAFAQLISRELEMYDRLIKGANIQAP